MFLSAMPSDHHQRSECAFRVPEAAPTPLLLYYSSDAFNTQLIYPVSEYITEQSQEADRCWPSEADLKQLLSRLD